VAFPETNPFLLLSDLVYPKPLLFSYRHAETRYGSPSISVEVSFFLFTTMDRPDLISERPPFLFCFLGASSFKLLRATSDDHPAFPVSRGHPPRFGAGTCGLVTSPFSFFPAPQSNEVFRFDFPAPARSSVSCPPKGRLFSSGVSFEDASFPVLTCTIQFGPADEFFSSF